MTATIRPEPVRPAPRRPRLSGCVRRSVCLLAVGAGLLAGCGSSDSEPVSTITVTGAWARSTPPSATTGVVYFDLVSPVDDELIGVSVAADVASGAGLHETVTAGGGEAMPNMPEMDMGDGTTSMQELASVPLAAQARVRFEPGGKHVMLTGLTTGLEVGRKLSLTLTFRSGATVTIDAVVADNAPM